MLNEGSACQNFVLGNFEPATSTFVPAPKSQPRVAIDRGDVMFSEVNVVEGRMLHMVRANTPVSAEGTRLEVVDEQALRGGRAG